MFNCLYMTIRSNRVDIFLNLDGSSQDMLCLLDWSSKCLDFIMVERNYNNYQRCVVSRYPKTIHTIRLVGCTQPGGPNSFPIWSCQYQRASRSVDAGSKRRWVKGEYFSNDIIRQTKPTNLHVLRWTHLTETRYSVSIKYIYAVDVNMRSCHI